MDEKEMRNYLPISKVKPRGKLKRKIRYKPYIGCVVTVAFGVFAVCINNLVCRIMGGVLILIGLLAFFAVKSKKVMDVYSEGVTVYKADDETQAAFISFRNISGWSARRSALDAQSVMLLLRDDKYVYMESLAVRSIARTLRRLMPDKEIPSA